MGLFFLCNGTLIPIHISNYEWIINKYRANCEWFIPKYSGGINIKIMNDIFLNTGLIVNECGRNTAAAKIIRVIGK